MPEEQERLFIDELEKHKESLLRICSIYAIDSESKKDLFQESLLNIWKSLSSFENKSSMKTWMYRVTINVYLGLTTQNKRAKYQFVDIAKADELIYKNRNLNESEDPRLEKLRKCISHLNESNKAILALHLEEMPYVDISRIIGITENHVAVKLKRIRKEIYNCINNLS